MSVDLQPRVLALAGLLQSLKLVRQIAETGQADAAILGTALDSVFRIDAQTPEDVYGGVHAVRPGLLLMQEYFGNRNTDELLPRLALAVIQLERRFLRHHSMTEQVRDGILALAPNAQRLGSAHPEILAGLGRLYAESISHLRPRVLVQGNPHYLGQADIVAEVRAVLLAALRSAVLWRQMGGRLWDFLLRRHDLVETIEAALD